VIEIRAAVAADFSAIVAASVDAFDWRGDGLVTAADLPGISYAWKYVEGWMRPSDLGVVAEDAGRAVGAAWVRFFSRAEPGFGFVADDIPELSMGVSVDARGRGIGRLLLDALLDASRAAGVAGVSLSVEDGNTTARALYERSGFVVAGREGGSDTMIMRFEA
jgi:ribosomal protein S18 acetylase RimI-like enzyme